MRTLIAAVLFVATLASAQTYTNGITSPKLPVSDSDYANLKLLRRITGETNIPMKDFSTNYLRVIVKEDAAAVTESRKRQIADAVMECKDDELLDTIHRLLIK
jgi:hypothetical protein